MLIHNTTRSLSLAACIGAMALVQALPLTAAETVADEPIPGPRSCFWQRGPFGADPYINIAYPDANVYYWAAVFSTPAGAKLTLEGDYPRSRYMSFASYDTNGAPIESLPDALISPLSGPNPFVAGASRAGGSRSYALSVVDKAPDQVREIGRLEAVAEQNTLHAPALGPRAQQAMLYRIYLPDEGTAPAGGAALPEPVLTLADGQILRGVRACGALKTFQPALLSNDATSITPAQYRALISQEDKPDTWPARNPAQWHIQLDRESLLGIYTGKINEDARRSEGGFYPNPDNHYIRTIVNRKHGPVFLLRAKAPTAPTTFGGDSEMGDGDLRYWSVCSNQSFVNTRVNDCLFDEEIPVDRQGFFTVVVSRADDRPRNARAACGIGWLPMADDGDGMFDDDVTIVQIRHMLSSSEFPHAIEHVARQREIAEVMADYLPRSRYMQVNEVEALFPCLSP